MIGIGSSDKLPFLFSRNTILPHQPGYFVFTTNHFLILEFIMDTWATICASALLVDVFNPGRLDCCTNCLFCTLRLLGGLRNQA